jgi:flavin reductase (DIM6/NTAB) family NADH-FMN oxidoreductase RutF
MTVDGDTLRRVTGNFLTGVTVVTLPTEPAHGMTANAFSSVSLDPPLVLVCVDHGTTCYEHLSGDVDEYCVNVLAADQQDLGEHFAGMNELPESPFETRDTRTEATGAPIFEDGLAYLDCTVEAAHEAGDHTIYVGAVESTDVLDPEGEPLAFFRGEWESLG